MAVSDRVVALIPARLDSTRLPWKQLRPVHGRAMLWYLVERMQVVSAVEKVVIATTDRPVDTPLVDWANEYGIEVFRGEHEDLLRRFHSATQSFGADIVVRANGDNPLLAPEVTSTGVDLLADSNLEFVTGKCSYTDLPVGIGPEIIRTPTLQKLLRATKDPSHREHVTSYIFDHPGEFNWKPIPVQDEWCAPDLSITVDTDSDLAYVRQVVGCLPDRRPEEWSVEEVITACRTVNDDEGA